MKLKYSINFRLEKRKDRKTNEVITENVPIRLDFTYDGKRLTYFTGYRIDIEKWIDTSIDPETKEKIKVQKVKKNAINKDGIQYNVINSYLDKLKSGLENIYIKAKANNIDLDNQYICDQLDLFLGKKNTPSIQDNELFWQKWEEYITTHDVSEGRRRHLRATRNHFERFINSTGHKISFESLTPTLIKQFEQYLKEEGQDEIDTAKRKSQNTITGILKRVKAFFNWAMLPQNGEMLAENPFEGYEIKNEIYGPPICMTREERDLLYEMKLSNERLDRVRDIFVFQCLVGCRVGDLTTLKREDIIEDTLIYYPNKTKSENRTPAKVPLSQKAKAILSKYDLPDGSLLPYISHQKYNEYIKELFKKAELDRIVTRLNPLTLKKESIPLHEVATSHLARRTFIHLLHTNVKDSVIASMSGHAKGSKAFDRYYEVDDDTRRQAINKFLD